MTRRIAEEMAKMTAHFDAQMAASQAARDMSRGQHEQDLSNAHRVHEQLMQSVREAAMLVEKKDAQHSQASALAEDKHREELRIATADVMKEAEVRHAAAPSDLASQAEQRHQTGVSALRAELAAASGGMPSECPMWARPPP